MIDRNSDGCLDIKDFSLDGEIITGPHYEMWREVRDKFDYNGDGQVTLEEVRLGYVDALIQLMLVVFILYTFNTDIVTFMFFHNSNN